MRMQTMKRAVILGLAALAVAALSCSKAEAENEMMNAEELKKHGVSIDAKKGAGGHLSDIGEAAKSFIPGRDYVLPLPSTYADLAKGRAFGVPSPKSVDTGSSFPTLEQSALGMGVRGADGIILLYADPKDSRLEAIGGDLLDLAKRLGISEKLSASLAAMAKELKSGDAARIRSTLDEMVQKVDHELRAGNMNELALLVSLGGWIEVLDIYTTALTASFNADVAREVLPMTEILDAYVSSISLFLGEGTDPESPVGKITGQLRGPVSADFAVLRSGADEASLKNAVARLKDSTAAMKSAIGKGGN